MIKSQPLWLGICIAVTACLLLVPSAMAQPSVVEALPSPDSILLGAPEYIELTFDRAVSAADTTIEVRSADGSLSVSNSLVVDPSNRFKIRMEMTPLVAGVYEVHYSAKAIGGSTIAIGSYVFTIDPADPELELVNPVNGSAFAQDEPIILEMRTQNFEFGFYNNRIRIYIDGEIHDEIQADSYEIEGLSPGVHEIRTVLVELEGNEFAETENVIVVAIAQDDPETQGRIEAAIAEPDRGLTLNGAQVAGIVILTVLLLGLGVWLGRSSVG